MSRPIRLEPEAVEEIEEAIRWYDERRRGLGGEFLEAIGVTFSHIERWPRAGVPVPGVAQEVPVRRVPAGRFPYHVVYLETPKALRILAVAHDHRKPRYWQARTER